eukprot:CAMPEP_0202690964 /NCGR_PEP_ID=MMETSP1385-20130828/5819_1 /ASSEMBLY_ACC=CAM_ASM_000861 /TAXON_ID=933848 /ORGANISM="Elphidium margaritaceum" /LENGTH=149 /DNA_ID=CAMNT_0049346305 /DNA_START=79 /DNA_END=528 /DNA_ORIENTATION=+
MADSFFNDERTHELKEAFKVKADGADSIKTTVLCPLMEYIGLPSLSVKETIAIENAADPDKKGTVDFDSFMKVLKEKFAPPYDEEHLEKSFGVLRNPANKKLTAEEMKHFLLSYNKEECAQEAANDFVTNIPLEGNDIAIDKFMKLLLG